MQRKHNQFVIEFTSKLVISCPPQLLQNDLEVTKVDLSEIVPAATIMVVSVTASTTQGLVHTTLRSYRYASLKLMPQFGTPF